MIDDRLQKLGFVDNGFDELWANACHAVLYRRDGEYALDVLLPNGGVLGAVVCERDLANALIPSVQSAQIS
jgi:hypothetical protein